MSTKAQYRNGILHYYDSATFETLDALAPVWWKEDFVSATINSTVGYGVRDTGGATETLTADAAGGSISLTLDATNEAQLAGVDMADQRTWILNQGLVFEARVKLSTLPTTGTIACIGLCGDHNAAVDTVAESIWFRLDGATGGLITVETDDTVNETSKVTTGVTVTTADWVVLRIDCTTITDIRFYINGARVAEGTTFTMAQVAGLKLQPVARIGKESAGTNLGVLLVDYLAAWMNRS